MMQRESAIQAHTLNPSREALDAEWHVGIGGNPVGPLTWGEMLSKFRDGDATKESLVWREGFADWRPARVVNDLAPMFAPPRPSVGRAAPAPAPPPRSVGQPRPMPPKAPVPRPGGVGARISKPQAARPSAPEQTPEPPPAAPVVGDKLGRSARKLMGGKKKKSPEKKGKQARQKKIKGASGELKPARPSGGIVSRLGGLFSEVEASQSPEDKPTAVYQGKDVDAAVAKSFGTAASPQSSVAYRETEPLESDARSDNALEDVLRGSQQPSGRRLSSRPEKNISSEESFPEERIPRHSESRASVRPSRSDGLRPSKAELPQRRFSVATLVLFVGAASFGITLGVMAGMSLFFEKTDSSEATASTQSTDEKVDAKKATPKSNKLGLVIDEPQEDSKANEAFEFDLSETADPDAKKRSASSKPSSEPAKPSRKLNKQEQAVLARMKQDMGRSNDLGDVALNDFGGSNVQSGKGLDAKDLSKVVQKNRPALSRCYSMAIRGMGSPPSVRMDIRVSIGASGRVKSVSIRGNDVGNLGSCIESRIRKWNFPPAGASSKVQFPLIFQAGG